MDKAKRLIKVFIASPGDLAKEREYFRQILKELNAGFGEGANVEFIARGWEDCSSNYGRRPQSIINELINDCELFILAMYKRWGQEAKDSHPSDSYTEEEFQYAQALFETNKSPRIFVFFKNVEPKLESDPDSQLKKVIAFKNQLIESNNLIFRRFSDEHTFREEIQDHLKKYVKGELPEVNNENDVVVYPTKVIDDLKKAKQRVEEAEQKATKAEERIQLEKEKLELEMAQDAANLSKEGNIEYARQKFAKLSINSTNKEILFLSYEFYFRTCDFVAAESVAKRAFKLAKISKNTQYQAEMAGNLGNVYRSLNDYKLAKKYASQALKIFGELGAADNIAIALQVLGTICFEEGDIKNSQKFFTKAFESFSKTNNTEGLATVTSNLGDISSINGYYSDAESKYKKSLNLSLRIGNIEGVADQLGKLAQVNLKQSKYDDAMSWSKKALIEDIKLGRKKAIAHDKNLLGLIYKEMGNYPNAEKELNEALSIAVAEGFNRVIAEIYGNLGTVYALQAMDKSVFQLKVDMALEAYKKALVISESVGNPFDIVSNRHNLGVMYLNLHQISLAEPLLFSALEISQRIDDKEGMAGAFHEIGRLYSLKGKTAEAIKMVEKAIKISDKLKSSHLETSLRFLQELKSRD